jgi:hypothetical protein
VRGEEMTASQLQERRTFVDALASAGWADEGWELLFKGGADLTPQARGQFETRSLLLRVDYFVSTRKVLFECYNKINRELTSFRFDVSWIDYVMRAASRERGALSEDRCVALVDELRNLPAVEILADGRPCIGTGE